MSSRKRLTIQESSDEEDEPAPKKKFKPSKSKMSKSRSNSPTGIPKQSRTEAANTKTSLLIKSMQPKPQSATTGTTPSNTGKPSALIQSMQPKPQSATAGAAPSNTGKPSPLIQSMQPKPQSKTQSKTQQKTQQKAPPKPLPKTQAKPQPKIPQPQTGNNVARRDRPRPPGPQRPPSSDVHSPAKFETYNPQSMKSGHPQQIVQKKYTDQEKRVVRKIAQICNSITLTYPLQKEIDLSGSFIEKEMELDIFDMNEHGAVVLQPRIPIFPEDFSQDHKEWPLSWWGIEEPDPKFLDQKQFRDSRSSSRHGRRENRQRERDRRSNGDRRAEREHNGDRRAEREYNGDRRGEREHNGDRRGDRRPGNYGYGPPPPERVGPQPDRIGPHPDRAGPHRDQYYGPPGGVRNEGPPPKRH